MGHRNHWRRDSKGVARMRVGAFALESAKTPDGADYYWRMYGADGAMLRAMRGYQTEWDARQAAEAAANDDMPIMPSGVVIDLADYRNS